MAALLLDPLAGATEVISKLPSGCRLLLRQAIGKAAGPINQAPAIAAFGRLRRPPDVPGHSLMRREKSAASEKRLAFSVISLICCSLSKGS
jgi:hypothetical protein